MRRLPIAFGLGILTLSLLVTAGTSQDAKKDEKKEKKLTGFLPPGFKDLNITAEQKAKVYTIQAEYKAKIADLNMRIAELKKQENLDVFKVLTDAQREQYQKNKFGETKDKKDKAPEKDKK